MLLIAMHQEGFFQRAGRVAAGMDLILLVNTLKKRARLRV